MLYYKLTNNMNALKVNELIANFINYNAFNAAPYTGNAHKSRGHITLSYRYRNLKSYDLEIGRYYMGRFVVYNHTATNPYYLSFRSKTTSKHINALINQLQAAGIPYTLEGRHSYDDFIKFRYEMLTIAADVRKYAIIQEGRRVVLQNNILLDDIYKYVITPYI